MIALATTALIAILCAIIVYDLRHLRIPNALSILLLLLFAVLALWRADMGYAVQQVLLAVGVFAVCFAAFAARAMGGGDAKILPALSLFVPVSQIAEVLLLFAAVLFISICGVVVLRRTVGGPDRAWAVLRQPRFPMGLPIGLTGLIAIGFGAGL